MTKAALIPVFALVLLALFTGVALGLSRSGAIRRREVRMKDVALGGADLWPERVRKIAASYANQLEMPVLFYVLVALALPLERADGVFIALEWVYVVLRYAHAYIHMSDNVVPRRFLAFAGSAVTLLVLWVYFALRVLLA